MDEKRFSTDVVMRIVWLRLLEDLRHLLPHSGDFAEAKELLLRNDIPGFREALSRVRLPYWAPPNVFKAVSQLKEFHSRYIFAEDVLNDDGLVDATWLKYHTVQTTIATPFDPSRFYRTGLVRRWRSLAREILGEYSQDEHLRKCEFAKKACVGHPHSRKRLDHKVMGPLTGSWQHLKFMRLAQGVDPHLARMLKHAKPCHTTRLKLTFVPKSYKIHRIIMPNTLAGSFYSKGLGEVISDRLENIGLDISRLQVRHQRLAREASRTKYGKLDYRLATLDLSSASDSISSQLLMLILPKEWYRLCQFGRIPYYTFKGSTYLQMSACTMGLGHTFALETLVFYILIKGVADLVRPGSNPLISVYGDDIIIPEWLVNPVTKVLMELKFTVNVDKSFHGLCDFRESCGGDFYRGIPVRPCRPELTSSRFYKRRFVAYLYSVANGLLLRWPSEWINGALSFLARSIYALDGFVLSVPPSFPDESGLKVAPGSMWTDEVETINFGSYVVRYWRVPPKVSPLETEAHLLWDRFRKEGRFLLEEPKRFSLEDELLSMQIRRLLSSSDSSPLMVRWRRRGTKRKLVAFSVDPGKEDWRQGFIPRRTVSPQWL